MLLRAPPAPNPAREDAVAQGLAIAQQLQDDPNSACP